MRFTKPILYDTKFTGKSSMSNITVDNLPSPSGGISPTLVYGVVLFAATVAFALTSHVSPSTGPMLPPTVMLEAALDTDRLSSSKIVAFLRFILARLHPLISLQHTIIPDNPTIERQLIKNHDKFDAHPMGTAMLKRIFGCQFKTMNRAQYASMHDNFMKVIARDFVNDATATATLQRADIPGMISNLVTFPPKRDQNPWERLADVSIIDPQVAELSLEPLLKSLSSCVSIPLLYGEDYLVENPSVLADWDCFASSAVPLLALGMPSWVPLPGFRRGVAARGRLLHSLGKVYERMQQQQDGDGDEDGNRNGPSAHMVDRLRVFDQHNVSEEERVAIELSMLWAQNKNTQMLLFWFVFYIYSVPGLLGVLRREVAGSGALILSGSKVTGLDIAKLGRECLLLKSCFLETFRLTEESVMFRQITGQVSLDEGTVQHSLRPGSWVSISNCRTKHDESLYSFSKEFVPDRFIDGDSEGGQRTVTYGPLRPWGIGPGVCKGRTFAEKQLLALAACMITLWDVQPVGGEWKHPGFKAGATILAPLRRVRVRVRRRGI